MRLACAPRLPWGRTITTFLLAAALAFAAAGLVPLWVVRPGTARADEPARLDEPAAEPIEATIAGGRDSLVVVGDQDDAAAEAVAEGDPPAGDDTAAESDTPRPAPDDDVAAARFKGVQPGTSTIEDVESAFGAPEEVSAQSGFVEHRYHVEPFDHVTVTFADRRVASIVVTLSQNFTPEMLAEQLGLDSMAAVVVPDDEGHALGQVYPERGVLFSFDPREKQRRVAQIILEEIDAQPFVMRAEFALDRADFAAMDDIERALAVDPKCARAYWLQARLLQQFGRLDDAQHAIDAALSLEPDQLEYRLTHASLLFAKGQIDEGRAATRTVLEQSHDAPEVHVHALLQLGNQLAAGAGHDVKQALEAHLEAIKTAQVLLKHKRLAARNAAREVLFEAHIQAAREIAWGQWNRKVEAVGEWLARAGEMAAKHGSLGGDTTRQRFRLSRGALAAAVGLNGGLDPAGWTQMLLESKDALAEQATDEQQRAWIDWEAGLALSDAVQVMVARRDVDQALTLGELAVDHLERGAHGRDPSGEDAHRLGRLFFRIGSIHAVHRGEHGDAVVWFDEAVPLLEQPLGTTLGDDVGRRGETLVSMGVSYWETGQREKAVELTEHGAELMQQAVEAQIMPAAALTVPYDNLASMHRVLGDDKRASEFEGMAARSRGPIAR